MDSVTNASAVPHETLAWLQAEENPAVAVLTRRLLLGEADTAATAALWQRRNEYAPVARILQLQHEDGSWETPARDYKKYQGSLWQIIFLGELWADPLDPRVLRGAEYAFSRQLDDGSWSASNMRAAGSIPCLTANVGRSLARLGFAEDPRTIRALEHCVRLIEEVGALNCRQGVGSQLSGYCHMLAPKLLLFLAEVPTVLWPTRAAELRDLCIQALRDKQVLRCLPVEAREFNERYWETPSSERAGLRERFLLEAGDLHFKDKPGWLRFGFPLSYNSDALEALVALAAVDEPMHPEYGAALAAVRSGADDQMRWRMRNTLNGKMLADVEVKGEPSRWLTLRALHVLQHFDSAGS